LITFLARMRELERANRTLRDALSWYAKDETWRRRGVKEHGGWVKSPAAHDRGALAARVLQLTTMQARRGVFARLRQRLHGWRRPYIPPFLRARDR
jgi:hypothetical protein